MLVNRRGFLPKWVLIIAAVALTSVMGCGSASRKTYPVSGRIELDSGDITQLTGSHVEAALEGDSNLRAAGEIQSDGSFTLETLDGGEIRKGARPGTYLVRLVPDDYKTTAAGKSVIGAQFRRFETSGLTFAVPAKGKVTLRLMAQ